MKGASRMGILDNVTAAVNRGTAAAGRSADKLKLNTRINELNKQRQGLAAQLGASLYDATQDDAGLREGREALYDGIAAIDAEREDCKRQIAALEEQAQQAASAASGFTCAVCGAHMGGTDLFCSGCGSPVDKARPAEEAAAAGPSGTTCASCGAPVGDGDLFCMACGAKQEAPGDASGIGEDDQRKSAGMGEPGPVEAE